MLPLGPKITIKQCSLIRLKKGSYIIKRVQCFSKSWLFNGNHRRALKCEGTFPWVCWRNISLAGVYVGCGIPLVDYHKSFWPTTFVSGLFRNSLISGKPDPTPVLGVSIYSSNAQEDVFWKLACGETLRMFFLSTPTYATFILRSWLGGQDQCRVIDSGLQHILKTLHNCPP